TWLADINGDGKPDLVYAVGTQLRALQTTGAMVPEVAQIVSEIGGVTRISYATSTTWSNSGFVPVVPTVLNVSVDDGRGKAGASVYQTAYTYYGGLYDFINRRFLSFRTAVKTLPCLGAESLCPLETTYFAQDYGSLSKPTNIYFQSGAPSGGSRVLLKY